jgi:GNAT superfamily N-acetyltransferase
MVSDILVEQVTRPLGQEWEAMTFPLFRQLLPLLGTGNVDAQGHRPIACRAIEGETPAGLVLGQVRSDNPSSLEMLSILGAPDFRGRGVATKLLAALEDAARGSAAVRQLTGVYMTGRPSIPALERVFAKCGFPPPALRMIVLKFTPEEAATCDWYKKARMPAGCTIFPWVEMTDEERARLKQSQADRAWIHPELEPWRSDKRFDEVSSVGMRKDGEVVGWVINHRASPTLVTFTTSFIRADLARRGGIFPLYVASIERLMGSGVICSFVTSAKFESMVRFALRRGAPFIHYTGETREASKALASRDP